MEPPERVDLIERIALGATAACLAHCIALPLILALLPALATVVPVPESVHLAALLLAVPTTVYALGAGFRHHGAPMPLLCGMAGLLLLVCGAITVGGTPLEAPATVAGSLLIGTAHLANWRLRRAG